MKYRIYNSTAKQVLTMFARMANKNCRLTKHFKLKEFIVSKTYPELLPRINDLLPQHISNLTRVACVLEDVRKIVQAPIKINSGIRTVELNKKLGGSKTSQHLYGEAADFIPISDEPSSLILAYEFLAKHPQVAQVFLYKRDGYPIFVHVGVISFIRDVPKRHGVMER